MHSIAEGRRGGRWPGIAGAALLTFSLPAHGELAIFRPKIGVPAFAEPGGAFRVEVIAPPGLAPAGWTIALGNDLRVWTNGSVAAAEYGADVYNDSVCGYRLMVRTPADVPPELLGLTVSHPGAGVSASPNSVSIVPRFETRFCILHQADPQVRFELATDAAGVMRSAGAAQKIAWSAAVYNLIHPRFVLDTGDEVDDGETATEAKYAWYLAAVRTLRVPLLVTRGNNDRSDTRFWTSIIGQPTYSVTMGSFYVCLNDVRDARDLAWLRRDYAATFASPGITFRLIAQHFIFNLDGKNPAFFEPEASQPPNLMLVGHIHRFLALQRSPYPILASGPASGRGDVAILEFQKTSDGWTCPISTNYPAGYVIRPFDERGAPTVSAAFRYGNDGSRVENTAVISNAADHEFRDGWLRFLMRRAARGYRVSGGEKVAEYDYAAGSNTAVLVRVPIRRHGVTEVSVSAR